MNSTFNSALKQSSSIRKDLETFASSPSSAPLSLQGQISASLTSLARTLDDYEQLSKRELNPAKAEKATERIKNFRNELADYRERFAQLKKDRDSAPTGPDNATSSTAANRAELLGRRPHHTATPENPYANAGVSSGPSSWPPNNGHDFGGGAGGLSTGSGDFERESHAFREQSFLASTNATLDEYLARGQAVLGDLGQQREMLKGTQKRLYSAANTLGISGDTIRMVERRAKQDRWIFGAGVVIFFTFCWLVLHYLG